MSKLKEFKEKQKKLKEGKIIVCKCENDPTGKDRLVAIALKCETDFLVKTKVFENTLHKVRNLLAYHHDGLMEDALEKLKEESGERVEVVHMYWDVHPDDKNWTYNYYLHHDNKKVSFIQLKAEGYKEEVEKLAYDLAMQHIAIPHRYVYRKCIEEMDLDIPDELLANKPQQVIDKIIAGKREKYYEKHVLVDQKFIKDVDKTVGEVISEFDKKYGTNVEILGCLQLYI